MFVEFFLSLRDTGIPVSLREYLTLIEAVKAGVAGFDIDAAEKGNPPRLFIDAYRIAREGRLGLTAHVGEDEGLPIGDHPAGQ